MEEVVLPKLVNRFIAKILDFFIMLIFAYPLQFVFSPLPDLVAMAYILSSDAFPHGRSLGKRMLHLKVINSETKKSCNLKQSMIRNVPFGLLIFFRLFPASFGSIFTILLALPFIGLEIYFLVTLDTQKRLGDVIADTCVVEADDHDPEKLVEQEKKSAQN